MGVLNPVRVMVRPEGQRGRATPALIVLSGDPKLIAEAQLGSLAGFEMIHRPEVIQPSAEIIPHDDLVWRRAAQIQQEAADGRAWRAARDTALRQPMRPSPARRVVSGDPVASEVIPEAVRPRPARQLVRLAQPAVDMRPLRAPLRFYAIDADGPRLIWWQGLGDAVADVFDRWRALDNPQNPDAWA